MYFRRLVFWISAASLAASFLLLSFFKADFPMSLYLNLKATSQKHERLPKVEDVLYNDEPENSLWSRFSDLPITDDLVSRAVHLGDTDRLRKVLRKVLKGENITLAVMGGSNSAGGYLGADEKSLDGLYFKVFTDWWKKTIARVTKSFVKERELAIGGSGSYFYAYCFKTLLTEGEKIDIILIDVSVNDPDMPIPLEQLTRQVLKYPSEPAMIYVNFVHRVGPENPSCVNLESFGQVEIAHYYGIASLSLREILCRKVKGNWEAVITSMTATDGNHVDGKAHALVAMMMIKYVKSVFKDVIKNISKGIAEETAPEGNNLPKFLFIERKIVALEKPLCWTGKTPDANNPLHRPNLQFKIINKNGFSPCLFPKADSKPLRPDAEGGWCARKVLSTLKMSIFVPSLDSASSRSVTVLISKRRGKAVVWFDNEKNKAVKIREHSEINIVAKRISPGYHNITFETVRNGLVMVSGIFVGPPDF